MWVRLRLEVWVRRRVVVPEALRLAVRDGVALVL